jgi:hypothetical protein
MKNTIENLRSNIITILGLLEEEKNYEDFLAYYQDLSEEEKIICLEEIMNAGLINLYIRYLSGTNQDFSAATLQNQSLIDFAMSINDLNAATLLLILAAQSNNLEYFKNILDSIASKLDWLQKENYKQQVKHELSVLENKIFETLFLEKMSSDSKQEDMDKYDLIDKILVEAPLAQEMDLVTIENPFNDEFNEEETSAITITADNELQQEIISEIRANLFAPNSLLQILKNYLNVRFYNGELNLLMLCVENNFSQAVELLVNSIKTRQINESFFSVTHSSGLSALQIAIQNQNIELIRILVSHPSLQEDGRSLASLIPTIVQTSSTEFIENFITVLINLYKEGKITEKAIILHQLYMLKKFDLFKTFVELDYSVINLAIQGRTIFDLAQNNIEILRYLEEAELIRRAIQTSSDQELIAPSEQNIQTSAPAKTIAIYKFKNKIIDEKEYYMKDFPLENVDLFEVTEIEDSEFRTIENGDPHRILLRVNNELPEIIENLINMSIVPEQENSTNHQLTDIDQNKESEESINAKKRKQDFEEESEVVKKHSKNDMNIPDYNNNNNNINSTENQFDANENKVITQIKNFLFTPLFLRKILKKHSSTLFYNGSFNLLMFCVKHNLFQAVDLLVNDLAPEQLNEEIFSINYPSGASALRIALENRSTESLRILALTSGLQENGLLRALIPTILADSQPIEFIEALLDVIAIISKNDKKHDYSALIKLLNDKIYEILSTQEIANEEILDSEISMLISFEAEKKYKEFSSYCLKLPTMAKIENVYNLIEGLGLVKLFITFCEISEANMYNKTILGQDLQFYLIESNDLDALDLYLKNKKLDISKRISFLKLAASRDNLNFFTRILSDLATNPFWIKQVWNDEMFISTLASLSNQEYIKLLYANALTPNSEKDFETQLSSLTIVQKRKQNFEEELDPLKKSRKNDDDKDDDLLGGQSFNTISFVNNNKIFASSINSQSNQNNNQPQSSSNDKSNEAKAEELCAYDYKLEFVKQEVLPATITIIATSFMGNFDLSNAASNLQTLGEIGSSIIDTYLSISV